MTDFDARARTWDEPAKIERARRFAALILAEARPRRDARVLEVGAGTGLLGLELLPSVGAVTLVDTSREMLSVAREKIAALGASNASAVELDLTHGELPPERYDLVCAMQVLHHVGDVDALLARFHALLAPGGSLCLADLDAEDGSFHAPERVPHDGFDREQLGRALRRAGFDDVRFSTCFEIAKGGRRYPVFAAVAARGGAG